MILRFSALLIDRCIFRNICGAGQQAVRSGATGIGETVNNLGNRRRTREAQRLQLDFTQELNHATAEPLGDSSEFQGLISSYELVFRMQGEMPKVLDLSHETSETLKLYGIAAAVAGEADLEAGSGRLPVRIHLDGNVSSPDD